LTNDTGLTGVFSLPMRNWNLPHEFQRGPAAPVFSLPMRNWNLYGSLSQVFLLSLNAI